jgi:hypothetical protein
MAVPTGIFIWKLFIPDMQNEMKIHKTNDDNWDLF